MRLQFAWMRPAAHQRRLLLIALAFAVSAATTAVSVLMLLNLRATVARQLARTGSDQARYAARMIGDAFDNYSSAVRAAVFQGVAIQSADPEPPAHLMLERLIRATAVPGLHDSLTGAFHFVPSRGFTDLAGAMTRPELQAWVGDSIRARIASGGSIDVDVNVSRDVGPIVIGAWLVRRGASPADGIDGITFIRSESAPRLVDHILRTVPLLPPSVVGTVWYRGRPIGYQQDFGVTVLDRGTRRLVGDHLPRTPVAGGSYTGTYAVAHGAHGQEISVALPRRAVDKSLLPELQATMSPRLPLALLAIAALLTGLTLWGVFAELHDGNDRRIFLSKLAHELRTPLSSIRAYSESLARGTYQSPESTRRAADAISRGVNHLARLVENVLTHSRSQVAGWRVHPQTIDLSATVNAAVDAFEPIVSRRVPIHRAVTPDIAAVADPFAIRQIVSNLVDNALRHSPPTTRVTVTLSREPGDTAVVSVADNGGGFPAGILDRLGAPFIHDTRGASPAPGAGIGLSIATELAREHGGTLTARNADGGAVVAVRIPLSPRAG